MKLDLSLESVYRQTRHAPTTNLRLLVTLFIWGSVGWAEVVWFVFHGAWVEIPVTFAGLLTAMALGDAVQFAAKRRTHNRFGPQGNGGVDTETDDPPHGMGGG